MKFDVVIPNGNEKELLVRAKLLGIDKLIAIYPKLKGASNLCIKGLLIDPMKYPRKAPKGELTFVKGGDRHVFEKLRPRVIFALEELVKKDKTHFRLSGLTDVECKLAKKNKIAIGFSLDSILHSKLPRQVILGRIMQNIRFCRKYKVEIFIATFASRVQDMRAPHDLKALMISLGLRPGETTTSLL